MEILPFSCRGNLIFSSNDEQDCGTECEIKDEKSRMKFTKLEEPKRKGWTKWARQVYLL